MSEPGDFWNGYGALGQSFIAGAREEAERYYKKQGYQGPFLEPTAGGWTNPDGTSLHVSVMKKEIAPGITAVVELVGAGIFGLRSWGYLTGPVAARRGIAVLAVRSGYGGSAAEKLERLAQMVSRTDLQGLGFRVHELEGRQPAPA